MQDAVFTSAAVLLVAMAFRYVHGLAVRPPVWPWTLALAPFAVANWVRFIVWTRRALAPGYAPPPPVPDGALIWDDYCSSRRRPSINHLIWNAINIAVLPTMSWLAYLASHRANDYGWFIAAVWSLHIPMHWLGVSVCVRRIRRARELGLPTNPALAAARARLRRRYSFQERDDWIGRLHRRQVAACRRLPILWDRMSLRLDTHLHRLHGRLAPRWSYQWFTICLAATGWIIVTAGLCAAMRPFAPPDASPYIGTFETYQVCRRCGSVRGVPYTGDPEGASRLAGKPRVLYGSPCYGSCSHHWRAGLDLLAASEIPDGTVILLKKGDAFGAVVPAHPTGWLRRHALTWYYRTDGRGTFRTGEPFHTGTARLTSLMDTSLKRVDFGPFSVTWQAGAILYAFVGRPIDWSGPAICVTHETDLSRIDARAGNWIYRRFGEDLGIRADGSRVCRRAE